MSDEIPDPGDDSTVEIARIEIVKYATGADVLIATSYSNELGVLDAIGMLAMALNNCQEDMGR